MFRLFPSRAAGQRLGTFFAEHFAPLKSGDVRPATLQSYQGTVKHWRHLTADPPLDRIDRASILAFRNSLRDPQQFPPPTPPGPGYRLRPHELEGVNKQLRNLRGLLREAADAELIRAAPGFKKVFFKTPKRRPRSIAPAILGRIYHAAAFAFLPRLPGIRPSDWWRGLIAAAVCTGFRRGALLALEWPWIDLDRRQVDLPAEQDKASSDRRKPLHSVLIPLLVKLRGPSRAVFPWPHSLRTFTREWLRVQRAAGIDPPVKFHDLKRFCGTALAGSGASVGVVQTMLDHASPTTSWGYYVDPSEETRRAVEAMPLPPEFFGPTPPPDSGPIRLVG